MHIESSCLLFQSRRDLQRKFKEENYFLLELWEVSKSHNGTQLSLGKVEDKGKKLKESDANIKGWTAGIFRNVVYKPQEVG